MTSRPLAALTGATGFLGAHLVRSLDAAGFRVRVLARRDPSPPGWGGVEPQVVTGDLSDPAALAALVDGAEVVVHAAGAIKASDREAFLAVNRDGTARLAEAARASRFLLVSSLAARHPEVSAYAFSKRAGEDAAAAVFGPALTIVRPPAIYGPGDRETFAIFKAAARSPVLPILSPRARLALAHVEDVAAAIAALAAAPQPGTWALADDRPQGYTWREILEAASRAVGKTPLVAPVPGGLVAPLARLASRFGLVAPDKLGELLHTDWAVSPEELLPDRAAPRYGVQEGFIAAADWYRTAGWLR